MKGLWCATCRVGSINCDGNACHPFKDWPRRWRITWTESSTTAALRYASEWWKPSTATSKPFLEGAAATKISPTYCSRRSAWRSQKQNLSFFRKPLKMQAPSNSCAEPKIRYWSVDSFQPIAFLNDSNEEIILSRIDGNGPGQRCTA